jgi:hypothetical protein
VTTDKLGGESGIGECGCKKGIGSEMYREREGVREVVNPDEIEIGLED